MRHKEVYSTPVGLRVVFYVIGDGTAISKWSSEPREVLTICRSVSKQRAALLLSYFKTLSVGPAGNRIRE